MFYELKCSIHNFNPIFDILAIFCMFKILFVSVYTHLLANARRFKSDKWDYELLTKLFLVYVNTK